MRQIDSRNRAAGYVTDKFEIRRRWPKVPEEVLTEYFCRHYMDWQHTTVGRVTFLVKYLKDAEWYRAQMPTVELLKIRDSIPRWAEIEIVARTGFPQRPARLVFGQIIRERGVIRHAVQQRRKLRSIQQYFVANHTWPKRIILFNTGSLMIGADDWFVIDGCHRLVMLGYIRPVVAVRGSHPVWIARVPQTTLDRYPHIVRHRRGRGSRTSLAALTGAEN
jgi:hypothetical protein